MANKKTWMLSVGLRYLLGPPKSKKSAAVVLSFIGIAIGVMAIIIVLSVIDGFQSGFIENIIEISSYHLQIQKPKTGDIIESQNDEFLYLEKVKAHPDVVSALPFLELQSIMRGSRRGQQGALVRGIPPDSLEQDLALARHLNIERCVFNLHSKRTIVLGTELALFLGAEVGDEISLLCLSGSALELMEANELRFTVVGLFRSGFYDYDLGWAFISLEAAKEIYGEPAPITYGIKVKDRWKTQEVLKDIATFTPSGYKLESWKDFNRAFFSALRTEKVLMFILMALIFVVVALNIFQNQRRTILERMEDIAVIKAIGAGPLALRFALTLNGFFIGFFGALVGLVPALLIAGNISHFFSIVEGFVNGLARAVNFLASFFKIDALFSEDFAIFSPQVFYIKDIPARLVPSEILFISLFAILSASLAAWLASARSIKIKPAEVLRYE